MKKSTPFVLAGMCAWAIAGCASPPPAGPAIAAGAASVDAASAAGAPELAAPEINDARNKLERARALAAAGNEVEAKRLAEEADAQAQLAGAKAGSERSRRAVAEVEASLQTLRDELGRRQAMRSAQ